MRGQKRWFALFVGPVLAAFMIIVIIPMITGIFYSFTDWNGINNNPNFVGLYNYKEIFSDKYFWTSFIFTAKFAFVSVFTINIMGFGLALLVTRGLKISNFLRSAFFLPNLIGGLILGFIWQFIFTKGFDSIGQSLGIDFLQGWLSDTRTGFWGLVILTSWQMAGYMMVIYIAAIQNIPSSIIEAAEIDGASAFQRLRHIIVPMVAPAFTIGIFLALSGSFKLYDQNLSLTNGDPFRTTEMLSMNIYNTAFKYRQFGQAQAKAVMFMICVAAISVTQIYFSKKKEVEL